MSFKASATLPADRYVEVLSFKQLTHNDILHFIIVYEQNLGNRHTAFFGGTQWSLHGLYNFETETDGNT
jgi:hypothetical protein